MTASTSRSRTIFGFLLVLAFGLAVVAVATEQYVLPAVSLFWIAALGAPVAELVVEWRPKSAFRALADQLVLARALLITAAIVLLLNLPLIARLSPATILVNIVGAALFLGLDQLTAHRQRMANDAV